MKVQGSVIIISAPSGTGKTSLVAALRQKLPNLRKSISHTTRQARIGEQDKVHYNFVSQEQFAAMLNANKFLEHAQVFNNFYGTSREWVEATIDAGDDVILEIDWQGAQQIRSKMSDVISIFVLPPSETVLLQRLESRNQDEAHVIKGRMQQAKTEVSHYNEYDYLIINDDFNAALADLICIVSAARLRTSRQKKARLELIAQFVQKP